MRADLVLLNNDPLVDIKALHQQAGVVVAGHWLPKDELARRLLGSLSAQFRYRFGVSSEVRFLRFRAVGERLFLPLRRRYHLRTARFLFSQGDNRQLCARSQRRLHPVAV